MSFSTTATNLASASASTPSPYHAPLRRRDRFFLIACLLGSILFGIHVEIRAAFLQRRQTDLDVFLRAAWAVRAGQDMYTIADENDWHYHYPPLFAILLTPLANPPPHADHTGYVPLAVSAAVWYLFTMAALAFAVHQLASILTADSSRPELRTLPTGCRLWWQLRLWPILICSIAVGQSCTRGQVSVLLLALLAGMAAATYRGQNWRAGLWLAGAICLKVIPVFLLLVPLWQRNLRCLAGCCLGLFVGLILIPTSVFGPQRTLEYYAEFDRKVLRPGVGTGVDQSRAEELTRVTSTDSQSIVAMIHNSMHLNRDTRPLDASRTVRGIHWVLGGLLTLVTLGAAGRRPWRSASTHVLFLGCLSFNMLVLSPVCHLHYYCLTLLTASALLAGCWEAGSRPSARVIGLLFFLNMTMALLPAIPALTPLRDVGLATYGACLLWLAACVSLRHQRQMMKEKASQHTIEQRPPARVAAA